MTIRFNLDYPRHQSSFEYLFSTPLDPEQPLWVNHIRTSPGFNTSPVPHHLVGIHLGISVVIAHARANSEKVHLFRPGDAIFTPMGDPIHYAHADAVEALYIDVLPAALDETAAQLGIDPAAVCFIDKLGTSDPFLFRIGTDLLAELRSPTLGSALYVETLSTQMMIHLLRHYTASTSLPLDTNDADQLRRRLQPVLDHVQVHYASDLSLKELAQLVYLTPAHFSRLFKRAYGLSPYQYVIQKRVDAARELLRDPSLTVADIALRVGFADHSHLIRHFKRVTGITPRG